MLANYFLSQEKIAENLLFIVEKLNEVTDKEDINSLADRLFNLQMLLGTSSHCCGSAEYYYQQNKKSPENQGLRTFADTLNEDLHKAISAVQSLINLQRK